MKICGIELKSNNAIVSVIEYSNDEISFIETKTKKIVLENDEEINSILKYKKEIETFLNENQIEKISIKNVQKKEHLQVVQ